MAAAALPVARGRRSFGTAWVKASTRHLVYGYKGVCGKVLVDGGAMTGNSSELCEVLDGEVTRHPDGFHAETATRVLFVRYATTLDATMALALCRSQGVLLSKLGAMSPTAAAYVYATVIPTPILSS